MDYIYNNKISLVYNDFFSNEYIKINNSYVGISMKDFRNMVL
jgi:hypothetical protein